MRQRALRPQLKRDPLGRYRPMAITETVRTAAKLFALPLGLLLGGALVVSLSHRSQARDQLRAECRAKYAAAGTRGDTILADNWIPAPGLQATRALRHRRDFGVRRGIP